MIKSGALFLSRVLICSVAIIFITIIHIIFLYSHKQENIHEYSFLLFYLRQVFKNFVVIFDGRALPVIL